MNKGCNLLDLDSLLVTVSICECVERQCVSSCFVEK